MINVSLRINTDRHSYNVEEDTTIREFLEDNDVDYGTGSLSIDGSSLTPGQIDKTFAELCTGERCVLGCYTKLNNA